MSVLLGRSELGNSYVREKYWQNVTSLARGVLLAREGRGEEIKSWGSKGLVEKGKPYND